MRSNVIVDDGREVGKAVGKSSAVKEFRQYDTVKISKSWKDKPKDLKVGTKVILQTIEFIVKGGKRHIRIGYWKPLKGVGEHLEYIYVPEDCVEKVDKRLPLRSSTKAASKPEKCVISNLTDNQKYFVDLLFATTRKQVVDLALEGVDLDKFEVMMDKNDDTHKYIVLIPKESKHKYLPMLMAHTDIHPSIKAPTEDTLYFDAKDKMFEGKYGLGADDKAGIYAINQVMRSNPNDFMYAFFDEEEIGCIGSNLLTNSKDFEAVCKRASAFISVDRKRGIAGKKHIATYTTTSSDLNKLVKEHTDRESQRGSSTDCATLARGSSSHVTNGIACFNMSCGYLNEHSSREKLYWDELEETVDDLKKLLKAKDLFEKQFKGDHASYPGWTYGSSTKTKSSTSKSYEKILEELVKLYSGKKYMSEYIAKRLLEDCVFAEDDEVIINPNVSIGDEAYELVLTQGQYIEFGQNVWVVEKTKTTSDGFFMDIKQKHGYVSYDNVPMRWFIKRPVKAVERHEF